MLSELRQRLDAHQQQHLLNFWNELDDRARAELQRQIEAVDFELIEQLWQESRQSGPPIGGLADAEVSPPVAVRCDESVSLANGPVPRENFRESGEAALKSGKVAFVVVAGGQGTRLNFEHPKGLYPIGPLSHATLFQIHCEKIKALSRKYDQSFRLLIMTSPATHAQTQEFLDAHNNFGLASECVTLFCQGVMPSVDQKTGKLLLASKGRLALSPDGHGGTLAALTKSGLLRELQEGGIEDLFYFQVDNPLTPLGDGEALGLHHETKSDLTSLAIAKERADEKLGVFAQIEGRTQMVEYIDLPPELASATDHKGGLLLWAGNPAIHIFRVEFLHRAQEMASALPFHIQRKIVPSIDHQGRTIRPSEANALKFERFIFDLLPLAQNPLVVEYERADIFAPIKNAPGAANDTPAHVQEQMVQLHRRWLEAAGAKVAPGARVEISPLFALRAAEVAKKIAPGTLIDVDQIYT